MHRFDTVKIAGQTFFCAFFKLCTAFLLKIGINLSWFSLKTKQWATNFYLLGFLVINAHIKFLLGAVNIAVPFIEERCGTKEANIRSMCSNVMKNTTRATTDARHLISQKMKSNKSSCSLIMKR